MSAWHVIDRETTAPLGSFEGTAEEAKDAAAAQHRRPVPALVAFPIYEHRPCLVDLFTPTRIGDCPPREARAIENAAENDGSPVARGMQ